MKYGQENTSLAWSRKHWGTKWNAFSQPDKRNSENTIYFETAWNGVPELILKIAWMFPSIVIEYSWSDEDLGYNVSQFKFKDTETLEEYSPDGGTKEIDLLFKKQDQLLNKERQTITEGIDAKEMLKVFIEKEKLHKEYEKIDKKIKKLQNKLYGGI